MYGSISNRKSSDERMLETYFSYSFFFYEHCGSYRRTLSKSEKNEHFSFFIITFKCVNTSICSLHDYQIYSIFLNIWLNKRKTTKENEIKKKEEEENCKAEIEVLLISFQALFSATKRILFLTCRRQKRILVS